MSAWDKEEARSEKYQLAEQQAIAPNGHATRNSQAGMAVDKNGHLVEQCIYSNTITGNTALSNKKVTLSYSTIYD